MPIEHAVFHAASWVVYWTAPGAAPAPSAPTPVANFTALQQKPSSTVTFDGSGSYETGGSIIQWLWDFGDGSKTVTGGSSSTTHSYAKAGTYGVVLTVTDAAGRQAQINRSVSVVLNLIPVSSFIGSFNGLLLSVNATNSSSPNGSITSYQWDFGDGATGTGITTSHKYSQGSSYAVTLKVTDNIGITATSTQTFRLSSVPIAAFTSSVFGTTATVDASTTIAPNPISAYSWSWGENASIPTYDYGSVTRTVALNPTTSGNVMQSATRSPGSGYIYMTQARNGTNGTGTPYQNTQITRLDASTGSQIDSITLQDAGHGLSAAIEYTGGNDFIWLAWQKPALSNGAQWDMVRFPWPSGSGTYSRNSPPPGMSVRYPGGPAGGLETHVQFDATNDRAILCAFGGNPTYRLVDYSDFLAGKITTIHTQPTPIGNLTWQGFCTSGDSFFIYTGIAYTQTAGQPQVNPTDPPLIRQFSWLTGQALATYDPSGLSKLGDGTYANSHYEPESVTLFVTSAGFPHLFFGWITGTTNAYNYDLYQAPLNRNTLTVPSSPGSGKTTSHTYSASGNYQVGLTVTDITGLQDSQTNTVYIGVPTPVNKPPVASFTYAIAADSAHTYNRVDFDASASIDSDGSIVSYAWDFGQSTFTTTSAIASGYFYNNPGTYNVKLTVTDNSGATSSVTRTLTISTTAPVNKSPIAAFSYAQSTTVFGRVDFDASASTDPDGSIARYDWDFGQSTFTTTSPLAPGYVYNNAGTYNVKLTVTDNLGLTNSQIKTVTIAPSVPTNQPPKAAFTYTATDLRVNFDASGSIDPDGSIVRYDWNFQQSTYSSTSPTASGYSYNAAGTYTVTLTVTDNLGLTGTTSKQVAVSASAPITIGNGDTGGNGVQQTGSGMVAYTAGSGDFSTRVNLAGSSNMSSLPAGTFTFNDFSYNGGGTPPTQFWFGAKISAKGILGAGSKYTKIQMNPSTSTKASDVPTQGTYQSNQIQYVYINTPGATIDGVSIIGTEQGHRYNGLRFNGVSNPTLTNSTISHIPGNAGSPPGETFGVNFQGCTGTVTVTNVTGDGGGVSAAMLGSNNSGATYNIVNLYTTNHPFSAGWASWEHTGIMNFHKFRMINGARAFNAERLVGTVNFYDPVWTDPKSQDCNPTYESGWTGGKINFYFSSASAWQAFLAVRSRKTIYCVTNASSRSLGLTKDIVKVYVGGVLQNQANYVSWNF